MNDKQKIIEGLELVLNRAMNEKAKRVTMGDTIGALGFDHDIGVILQSKQYINDITKERDHYESEFIKYANAYRRLDKLTVDDLKD